MNPKEFENLQELILHEIYQQHFQYLRIKENECPASELIWPVPYNMETIKKDILGTGKFSEIEYKNTLAFLITNNFIKIDAHEHIGDMYKLTRKGKRLALGKRHASMWAIVSGIAAVVSAIAAIAVLFKK